MENAFIEPLTCVQSKEIENYCYYNITVIHSFMTFDILTYAANVRSDKYKD